MQDYLSHEYQIQLLKKKMFAKDLGYFHVFYLPSMALALSSDLTSATMEIWLFTL